MRDEMKDRRRSLANIEHDDTIVHHECSPQSPSEVVQPSAASANRCSQTQRSRNASTGPPKQEKSSTFEIEAQANQEKVESWLDSQQVAAPIEISITSVASPTMMSKPNEKPTHNDGGVTTSHRQTQPLATKPELTSEDQKIDLSELASVITEAAYAGRPQMTSKYLSKLPTFNGSHNDWHSSLHTSTLFDYASEQITEEPDLFKLDKYVEKEAECRRFATT
ncbi:hypothetical protein EVAR_16935_1 [Eumeta japonica]|uniref:Uncharacterized protein n=1 Tax=Eumeta variegata TaxID=151549 RepID=A0A4C1TVC6_EUMVA|nr:hypothetical protein EVAR_16935_1 [Eumeta japonica]